MKTNEHVEYLLRQGRKPKELVELGFPKLVVTKVRRKLRKEKESQQVTAQKGRRADKAQLQPLVSSEESTTAIQGRLASLESKVMELQDQISLVKTAQAEYVSLEDVEKHVNGTPALGLRHRFKCECGTSGNVALYIQCTECGRKTWWGWFPKK